MESEPEFEEEQGDCKITNYEMKHVERTNIKLHLCDVQKLNDNTLLILLDTSIYAHDEYDGDGHNFLKCYNAFLLSNPEIKSLEELKQFQEDEIMKKIDKMDGLEGITNVIMVGHHPIAGYKQKDTIVEMDDITNDIVPFLDQLYKKCGNDKKYTYLCADYHSYQKGRIDMKLDNGSTMHIQQCIVGTGGTKLDDDLKIKYDDDNNSDPTYTFGQITYTFEENKHECGFLACTMELSGEWNFRFESTTSSTGGKTRKRRRCTSRRRRRRGGSRSGTRPRSRKCKSRSRKYRR